MRSFATIDFLAVICKAASMPQARSRSDVRRGFQGPAKPHPAKVCFNFNCSVEINALGCHIKSALIQICFRDFQYVHLRLAPLLRGR